MVPSAKLGGFERTARRKSDPLGPGQASYLPTLGRELAAPYRSGESPSLEEGATPYQKTHQITRQIRDQFGLSANLAVRSIRRVAACMTRLKGNRKKPKEFKPRSIDYDARIFSYREHDETVSLNTTKGRIRIPMLLGEHQRKVLIGKNPASATVIYKNGFWYIHMVVELKPVSSEFANVMGVDLGINNIRCLA